MAEMTHSPSAAATARWPRRFFKRCCSFAGSGEDGPPSISRQRRILRQDMEEEEDFNYGSARCLSSYYSVFVARLAIMVMLAILIGIMTILTWHFTRVYTTSSVHSLAYGLRYELLQRPILRMWNILNSTVEITMAQVKLSEYVIDCYYKPKVREQQAQLYEVMKNVTWALFASRRALNSITISYRDGFVQAFHRDHRSNNTFYIYSDLSISSAKELSEAHAVEIWQNSSGGSKVSTIWCREPLDPVTGQKIGDQRQVPPDDLINIAGFSEVRDGMASWHVAVSKFTDSPLLSAALPVRHPSDGSIVAAVGVTMSLYSVGQLMRELVEFHSGYMYLTSREGYVLATSTDAPLLRNSSTGPELMLATDSKDHMIKAGAEWLQEAYGDKFPISHEVHVENVKLGRQKYYIDSFFLNLKRLPLVGVIIIPRKYIMGKVDHVGFTTLVILITASVCILAIGCVLIMILTSGVSKEMKLRAELISHLDARRRAEASSNYKSQFLANMSHELRTPMAAVIGLLDILICDDCLTNEQVATITQIRKCSTALLRLLNNILDLSKVESGKLVLEEAEFDLGRELEGLVDMFSVQCINHNVETVLDLSDDMPKVVLGDSARVVQIFTNLISNSIKFTSSGNIILRGWCESGQTSKLESPLGGMVSQFVVKTKAKQYGGVAREDCDKNDRITLWFEVDDTGCGIDPSKWESVFESFEQADPSTTRTHGGTGLGLCIVRNLVNKMGGQIKVVKKDGPGTLMQLSLVLGVPVDDAGKHFEVEFDKHNLMVLLALAGKVGRFIMSQWLKKNGIPTIETSDWNGLTQILQESLQGNKIEKSGYSAMEPFYFKKRKAISENLNCAQNLVTPIIVIVVDTALLDLSTNIWQEQLIFLEQYNYRVKFAWILSHDTSNAVKIELQQKGHSLMVNRPLYKAKMIQMLDAVLKERSLEHQVNKNIQNPTSNEDLNECHDLDPIHFDISSSDSSVKSDVESCKLGMDRSHANETTREPYPAKHWASNPRKESVCAVCVNSVLQDPNCLLGEGDVRKMSIDFYGHEEYGSDNRNMGILEKNGKCKLMKEITNNDWRQPSEISKPELEFLPFIRYRNASAMPNQMDLKDIKTLSKEKCQIDQTLHDLSGLKQNISQESKPAASGNSRAGQPTSQKGTMSVTLRSSMRQVSKEGDSTGPMEVITCQCSLEGLYILLAEDTPILQRVATIMLQKMGASVVAVADGQQAVDALTCMFHVEECRRKKANQKDVETNSQTLMQRNPRFDLILMDCQMPKMDGYEATKEIRRLEAGTSSHIPIVALTAHAMSSDEARCLEVGMDAYLTKPIDSKLMESTILSLTKRMT
uniref:histidine kinase n=1 Tax=Anthurium amnicola TaxID=1678845 RepID=A0A1D1XNQ3_9ARAE